MKYVLVLAGLALATGCGDEDPGATGGQGGGEPTAGAGGGEPCGDVLCGAGEYCGFPPGECSGEQSCQTFPQDCPAEVACGCDGENYEGPCVALNVTGGISVDGPCAPPAGQFVCTYEYQVPIYCEIGAEYCQVTAGGSSYTLACLDQPNDCPAEPVDCECLADPCAENYCGIDEATTGLTVLCLPPM